MWDAARCRASAGRQIERPQESSDVGLIMPFVARCRLDAVVISHGIGIAAELPTDHNYISDC